jgi:hypothetical protein
MSHIPINHPLRPLYRALAVLTSLFVIVFGIVGFFTTRDGALFEQDTVERVFGLRTNLAFSLLSIVAGAVLLIATVIGRNVDKWVYMIGGIAFMAIGMTELGLLRTDLNYLAFSMSNVVVSFLIGMVLFAAALYGKSGTAQEAAAEEAFRHEGAVAGH